MSEWSMAFITDSQPPVANLGFRSRTPNRLTVEKQKGLNL